MKKILIIEDDPAIAEIEKDYLTLSGFEVTIEKDGVSGLNRALSTAFDMIIIDYMLPGLDGFSICQALRKTQDIPIMMITARDDDLSKTRGFELGLDDFLSKPFSAHELVARVKARLNRYDSLTGGGPTSTLLTDQNLMIELDSHRAFLNDTELTLTNKEFDLLVFFLQNPNKVFSRTDLFEKIWDLDAEGDISTVTVHIRRLRSKIELDTANPTRLVTIWGLGYKYIKQ